MSSPPGQIGSSNRSDPSTPARFQVLRCVGEGGMGVVHEALDRTTGERVALKTLRFLDAQGLYRLKKEFRALQDLHHHNLVRLDELVEEEGRWCLVMEYVPGVNFLEYVQPDSPRRIELATTLSAAPSATEQTSTDGAPAKAAPRGQLDEARLRSALVQLIEALNAVHAAGHVHRDIKPSNIRVTGNGRLVVLDFGLIVEDSDELRSLDGAVIGTPAYMAPEQALAQPLGPEADLYSVGVLLYEALTGTRPFTGPGLQVLIEKQRSKPAPPSQLAAHVPPDLDALCCDLLAFEPSDRPTGEQILGRLRGEAGQHGPQQAPAGYSITRAELFVGRTTEIDQLTDALAESRHGRAVTVFVYGESGIGKSALLRHFARTQSSIAEDTVVLRGRCYEREAVPFKALDGVVDSLSHYLRSLSPEDAARLMPRGASLLPRVFPVLGRVEPIAAAPIARTVVENPQDLRSRVFTALRDLLARVADHHPLIVIIDDLQWADADSLLLLRELMQPPGEPALLLLMSSRNSEAPPPFDAMSAADSGAHPVRELPLARLAQADALALAEQLVQEAGLSAHVDPAAVVRDTDGHPLFIDELIRHTMATGTDAASVRLDDAIWARANTHSAKARRLLETLAVAAGPLSEVALMQATDLDGTAFRRAISTLRVSNLVRAHRAHDANLLEPYHDRVRESVLAHIAPDEVQRHHERIATALECSPESTQRPELLLRHLESAGQLAKAGRYADEAGDRAMSALAFDRAAELFRAALRLAPPDGEALRGLRVRLAEALVNAGRGAEAAPEFVAAADSAEPAIRFEYNRRAAEQWLKTGHIQRGLDTVGVLLAEMGDRLPRTPKRALMAMLWHRTRLRLRGLGWQEKYPSQLTIEELSRVDVYQAVGQSLGLVDNIRAADFQTRGLIMALRTGERTRITRGLAVEASYVAIQGPRAKKRIARLVAETHRIADTYREPYLVAWANAVDGITSFFMSQYRDAVAPCRDAIAIWREDTTGTSWEQSGVSLFMFFAHRYQANLPQLREMYRALTRDAADRGDQFLETSVRRKGNLLWLADDNIAAARANLARATWMPPDNAFHVQHWHELEALAELAIYSGGATAALPDLNRRFDALRASLLLRAQVVRVSSTWLRARLLLAAAGETDGSEQRAHLAAAAKLARRLEREDVGHAHTAAALIRAAVALRSGSADRAMDCLRRAVTSAETAQLDHLALVASARIGELTGGDAGAELTRQSHTQLRELGVTCPTRWLTVYAPGLAG